MIAQKIIQPVCLMPPYQTDYDQDDHYGDVVWDYQTRAWVPRQQIKHQSSINQKEIIVYKAAVYVQGDFANAITKRMFYLRGYEIVDDIELADIVVWTGGADINPALYGEKPRGAIGWSDFRDDDDCKALKQARNAFKIGVCRGAQLLNCVENGGKLWQHVDRHSGSNHEIIDEVTKKKYTVNSIHHQAMIPTDKAEIVATANLSSVKKSYFRDWHVDNNEPDPDIEALWYPETKSLCMQWHCEFGTKDCQSESYSFELIDRFYHAA